MLNESGGISPLFAVASQVQKPWSARPGSGPQATGQGIIIELADYVGRLSSSTSFASIQGQRDQRLEAAVQLRGTDSGLREADELLAALKERLMRIVKQYPPFSQDSPQRITYLNSISGLRKQLDALAFPPERETRQSNADDLNWERAIAPGPSLPSQGDLAIPELDPRSASDDEVATALDAVMAAQQKVTELRASMWEGVVQFVGAANLGPASDARAQSQANEVKGYVTAHPGQGIGLNVRSMLATGV